MAEHWAEFRPPPDAKGKVGSRVVGLDPSLYCRKDDGTSRRTYGFNDLVDSEDMQWCMKTSERFDIVNVSTPLISPPNLGFLAKALPLLLKPNGRRVCRVENAREAPQSRTLTFTTKVM